MPKGFWGGNNEDDSLEFKPEQFKKELETAVTTNIDTKFGELDTKFSPILDFIKEQREEKQRIEDEKIRREEAQRNAPPSETDFITDPQAATRRLMQPLAQEQLKLAARMAKQDTLNDKEYYVGPIKDKVDEILSRQPLANQSDPSIILNTYKIVMFDHQQDITEGKIKSRNSAATFSSNGTGGHGSESVEQKPDYMSPEEKSYAAKLGISDKDWVASRKELEYV